MARIRTIKPEFWADEKLAPLPALDRLVFLGLISLADDAGRLLDNVRVVDAFLFPETTESSRDSLATLSRMGRIVRGKTESGQRVIEIVNWGKHQKVDKPNLKSAFPEIVEVVEHTGARESVANQSRISRDDAASPSRPDLRPTTYVGRRSEEISDRGTPPPPDGGAERPPPAWRERRGPLTPAERRAEAFESLGLNRDGSPREALP